MTTSNTALAMLNLGVFLDMTDVVVTGNGVGPWVVTTPDTVSQETLDAAVALAVEQHTELLNGVALLAKAPAAIQANKDYIANAAPTNAQVVAQSKAMARQMNAVMKILSRDLADTLGT